MVAMRIEIGNKYQSSNEISILNKLLINETFAKQEFLSSWDPTLSEKMAHIVRWQKIQISISKSQINLNL